MKPLQSPETCLFVNSKLCGKLFSSIPIMSDDNRRVTPVAFFL